MERTLNKIKLSLATLWTAIIPFLSKVCAQEWGQPDLDYSVQAAYGVYNPKPSPETIILLAMKMLQRLLVATVLIIGTVNLIRIKKIDDKQQKNEKIKKTIITVVIILITILLLSVCARLLRNYL